MRYEEVQTGETIEAALMPMASRGFDLLEKRIVGDYTVCINRVPDLVKER